jgi:hypothetical protein
MSDEDSAIRNRGREAVERAKRVAEECRVGFLIVLDNEEQRVFFRDANSTREVPTSFTEDDIYIASKLLPLHHPCHLAWDKVNSTAAGPRYDVYTAPGK